MGIEAKKKNYSRKDFRDAIKAADLGPKGGRFSGSYEREFNISIKSFEGMRVLDIGTGSSLRLANDFKREFIKADVVSFSPIFARKKFRKEAQEDNRPELLGMAVAGMGENLPFSDNSFDRILALHAFQYLNTQEGQDSFLNEIVRVLKKDGEAYIGPLFSGDKELLTPKLVKLRNTVRILHMLWSQNVAANTYKSKSRGPDSTAVNLMIRKAELKTIGLKPDIKTD